MIVMLAYSTRAGLAQYVGGSGLAGAPRYRLAGRVLSHAAVLALASVRRQKGRVVPPKDERRETKARE